MESEDLAIIISLIAIFINLLTILVGFGVFDWLIDLIDECIYKLKEMIK